MSAARTHLGPARRGGAAHAITAACALCPPRLLTAMASTMTLGEVNQLAGNLAVRPLTSSDMAAWQALYDRAATFATESPLWLNCIAGGLTDSARFTPVGIFANDDLIGVAPFVIEVGRVRRIALLGSFVATAIHDYPVVTALAEDERRVTRALLAALVTWSAQWTVATWTSSAQAYVLPQWLADFDGYRARPTVTRLQPIIDVPSWDTRVSRNLRESLRRGRNRLTRDHDGWSVVRHEQGGDWQAAVDSLVALQAARSELDRGPRHEFTLGSVEGTSLMNSLRELDKHHFRVYELAGAGPARAALLAATSPVGMQIIFSGMNREAWDYSPMPQLIQRVCEDAANDNLASVILPSGLDESKLRWGARVELRPEFSLVKPRLSARALHALHAAASEVGAQRRDARYRASGAQR